MIELIMWLVIGGLLLTMIYIADYYTTDEMRAEYRQDLENRRIKRTGSFNLDFGFN